MIYVCSAQAGCTKTFTKCNEFKRHKAAHSPDAHVCRFDGCDFVTLSKPSFEIHTDKHTGKQRYVCPTGCGFKTHNPASLTLHRKAEHGYVPNPRRPRRSGRTAAQSASYTTSLTSFQPQPQPQPQLQFQFQPQLRPQFQFQAWPQPQLQPQPQPPAPNQPQQNPNNMLGVIHARPNTVPAYTAPAPAPARANGWQPPAPPQYYYQYYPYVAPGALNAYNMHAAPAAGANGWGAGYQGYPYRYY